MPTDRSLLLRLLVGASLPAVAGVLPAFLVGAMGVQVGDELGFSAGGIGFAVAAFFAAASVGSAGLGRVAERIGAARALRIAAVWSAAAQLVVAVAAQSLGSLLATLALAGASNALVQPAANLFLARQVPEARQGLAFAVKQSAIPAASLLAGAAVPAVALTVGWRWAFVVGAAVGLLAAFSVPAVRETRSSDGARADRADAPVGTMALLALGVGLGASAAGTLGAFLVSAGVDTGMSEAVAGLTLTLGSAAGISVRVWAGVRADRRIGGHLRVVIRMLVAGAVAFALLATGVPWVHVLAAPLAFATGWAWPGLFNLAVVRANPRSPAAATGVTQTGTYVGAVVGPVLFGLLAERSSYRAAWLAAGATALAAAAAIAAARSRVRRDRALAALGPVPA